MPLGRTLFKTGCGSAQGAADRVFYETLFRQKPTCEMALIWCVEYGVFPAEEVDQRYGQYLKVR